MKSDWFHSTFYRAQNTSSRIMALLRWECGADAPCSIYLSQLVNLLHELGPECEQIYREATTHPALTAHEFSDLEARLRTQIEAAEEKLPEALENLEQFLFQPVCHKQILSEELDEIGMLRASRNSGQPPSRTGEILARAHDANLCGLALSGGGIRSATFNLGLLQGLAKFGLLPKIDYLSMVSGGGYIGGWLTAWIKRDGFARVQEALADEKSSPRGEKLQPLAFLRDYASYLTPKTGLFSADTWTAFMTWMRNTLLNLIVLLSGLGALMMLPRLLKSLQIGVLGWLHTFSSHYPEESLMFIAVLCEAIIIVHAGRNLQRFKHPQDMSHGETSGFGYSARKIQTLIIVPALIAAALGSARLWGLVVEQHLPQEKESVSVHLFGLASMVLACFVLLAYLQWRGGFVECYLRGRRRSPGQVRIAVSLCFLLPLLVAAVKAALLFGVYQLFEYVYQTYDASTRDSIATICGTPILLSVFAFCHSIHLGLMGRNFPDDRREWWSKIAAYLGIYAAAISGIFVVSLFGKEIFDYIAGLRGASFPAIASWAITTVTGLLLAQRNGLEKDGEQRRTKTRIALNLFISVSPVVFVAGLFIGLSTALSIVLHEVQDAHWNHFAPRLPGLDKHSEAVNPLVLVGVLACLSIVMFIFAKTVDVNEFSMHHFYRNRLIRAYLGASNCRKRRPNRLTGFDQSDDLALASLRPECEPGLRNYGIAYEGPYPIFNAALNLVHGDRLSWQQRKANSFVFTPKFCGYDFQTVDNLSAAPLRDAAFRPTSVYAYPDGGIHLGTAMAISGAALSPNSGFHTSTSMAFLLTVFNVRLGWWMGNPRNDQGWQSSGPRFGLIYLISELFGWTNDRQKQVYLSDGGHFDNLGIYELVRRRCSLIIASDAEEDAGCAFHGLGGVIRKCFIDFGVRIDIDLTGIRPEKESYSKEHFAEGVIHYPEGWTGKLFYLKSSLTGDEPADLQEYMTGNLSFPNQSTADQSFDESQFESYHRLGLHVAKAAFSQGSPFQKPALAMSAQAAGD